MDSLRVSEIDAGVLVALVLRFQEHVEVSLVLGRARAALTLREVLREKQYRHDSMLEAAARGLAPDLLPLRREIAFIEAAIAVIDAGGACTQEVEDDEKNAARRAEP